MAIVQWKPGARGTNPVTVMSTDLNALADAGAVTSAEISNDQSDELDLYMDLVLDVDFVSAPDADSLIEISIVRQVVDGEFEQVPPLNGSVGAFVLQATTAAQRLILPVVLCPPDDFKIYLINNSAQAFPATGTTVKAKFYTEQIG